MMDNESHLNSPSPQSGDMDVDLEKEVAPAEDERRREEIEELEDDERDARSAENNSNFRVPLQQVRTHSSTRSTKSYTDGYTHYEEQDDSGRDGGEDGAQDGSKEFEVSFDGENDPMHPKCKPTWRKWTIVLIGSFCSLCVTCASALYTSTYEQMEKDYGINREVATVGLTTYVCGLGLGPMFLGPLSEFYGRRIIYLCAFGGFFIWVRSRPYQSFLDLCEINTGHSTRLLT